VGATCGEVNLWRGRSDSFLRTDNRRLTISRAYLIYFCPCELAANQGFLSRWESSYPTHLERHVVRHVVSEQRHEPTKRHDAQIEIVPLKHLVDLGVFDLHDLSKHVLIVTCACEVSVEVVRGHDVLHKRHQAPERSLLWKNQKSESSDKVEPLAVPDVSNARVKQTNKQNKRLRLV
jgi:hypothetical protein